MMLLFCTQTFEPRCTVNIKHCNIFVSPSEILVANNIQKRGTVENDFRTFRKRKLRIFVSRRRGGNRRPFTSNFPPRVRKANEGPPNLRLLRVMEANEGPSNLQMPNNASQGSDREPVADRPFKSSNESNLRPTFAYVRGVEEATSSECYCSKRMMPKIGATRFGFIRGKVRIVAPTDQTNGVLERNSR